MTYCQVHDHSIDGGFHARAWCYGFGHFSVHIHAQRRFVLNQHAGEGACVIIVLMLALLIQSDGIEVSA